MGIYLGQLPPAEIARLKAELAETLIANFCYPRFFDYRIESLQMRPVDRAKRQEVWLYLSSVDFTAWSRIDLMSADFQHQIERLFIQFVQRNRSLFGQQGRRRMFDIRLSISSCAATVVQGLRDHLTGKKSTGLPFGSPRPVISWSTPSISGYAELSWEQIAASTMTLQQQLQELRGEAKTASVNEGHAAVAREGTVSGRQAASGNGVMSNGPARRASSSLAQTVMPAPVSPATKADVSSAVAQQPTISMPPVSTPAAQATTSVAEAARSASPDPVLATAVRVGQTVQSGPLTQPQDQKTVPSVARRADYGRSAEPAVVPPGSSSVVSPSAPVSSPVTGVAGHPPVDKAVSPATSSSSSSAVSSRRNISSTGSTSSLSTGSTGPREMMTVGEDDIAIFEQMRHQLIVWLRIEAITAGLEISNQGPAQLLELLRQQGSIDETRLQVVSTLLNLANQVIKAGLVSVLDYKQALMFHLMHTRR